MADQLLTFFASPFGIKRCRMLKIEMMNTMLVGDDDDLTHGDDVILEESTTDIVWTIINKTRRLSTFDNLRIRLNNIHFSHLCCSIFYANI